MFRPYNREGPEPIGLFITPQFSLMAVVALFDPLRVANKLSGKPLFDYKIVSEHGGVIAAANGMGLLSDGGVADFRFLPSVIVCSSYEPEKYQTQATLAWLRSLSRRGAHLGAIDTGCHLLASAGLLTGYRVTMHWEVIPGFVERYPDISVTDELFEIDRDRFTCAGGSAGYDMMIHMIALKHGQDLATAVAEQFVQNRIRRPSEQQRLPIHVRLGSHNPVLLAAVELMEKHLEDPLSMPALASKLGVSERHLTRLFRKLLDASPSAYYASIRLRRARELLQQTALSVLDIAISCGFHSPSDFSRAYRRQFGRTPKSDRHPSSYYRLLSQGNRHTTLKP